MNKPLVSIITPCYNMENLIERLMDSVIKQTYRPLEFILVDDGSTDNSLNVVKNYTEKFSTARIIFKIIHQENKGLGGAINAGLKEVTGEYLCWPDADDYLEKSSIEERVKAFEEHPECAVVTSNAYIRKSSDIDKYELLIKDKVSYHDDPEQFLYHLNSKSIFCPGCHMIKMDKFLEMYPDKEIYPARRGQNWQMLLPLYYKYPRYFLNIPLYNYIVYPNSMSKGDVDYESTIKRAIEHETILLETLDKISKWQNVDMGKYKTLVTKKYTRDKMNLARGYYQFKDYKKFFLDGKKLKLCTWFDYAVYIFPWSFKLLKKIKMFFQITKR